MNIRAISKTLAILAVACAALAFSTVPMPFGISGHKICFLDSNCTFSGNETFTGSWQLPIANGGTAASTASSARSNLGTDNAANITSGALTLGVFPVLTNNSLYANISGGISGPSITTGTAFLDSVIGSTQGSVIYRAITSWVALTPGTNGQFLQTQGSGANEQWASTKTPLLSSSSTTQAANSTIFYPCSGATAGGNATEINVQAPMPYAGTFSVLRLLLTLSPGVGQNYAATLRKNAADTAITCTSTAATSCNDTSHSVAFAAADKCTIKVISSATAAASVVSIGLELDTP